MKVKDAIGTIIIEFEEEAGDYNRDFVIDSKYISVGAKTSKNVRNGGTKYLIIPSSIISIGEEAFSNWFMLETLFIASGVTTYGKRCFYNCFKLEFFEAGKATKTISEEAFYECNSLKTIYLGKNITHIGKRAFSRISHSAVIYCEHLSQPSTFDKEWTDVPSKNIIWGYKSKGKQSTSSSSKVETKPKPKTTTTVTTSSTSKTTSTTATKKDSTASKTTSHATLKYCYLCKKSFPDSYQYCPICRAELKSETEYKAELEKDRKKQEQENKDKRENELLVNYSKKMYELLNKYDSVDIYTAICEVFHITRRWRFDDLRWAFKQCYNGKNYYYDSNFNREGIFKLYDVLIGHNSFKTCDAINTVNEGVLDIKEKLNKLNSKLKECLYIKNSESINYGELTNGWLNGGYFEITPGSSERFEYKDSGAAVCKHISYDIEKYYTPRSISSRIISDLRSTSSDYSVKYIMMMYEIQLIQQYLSDEIHQINAYIESRKRATVKYPQIMKMDQLVSFLVKNKVINKSGYRTSTESRWIR